jgi:dihydropteroate synthase
MLNVQIIDFALPSTRELYAKFYLLPSEIRLQDFFGYEFFDTDVKDESRYGELLGSEQFLKPVSGYLKNVYGLHLEKKQSHSIKQLKENIPQLSEILKRHRSPAPFTLTGRQYITPVIMGILNVTPDSFSDGGKFNSVESAVKYAGEMLADGADIIDIGGESTRPGSESVSTDEELSRVIPAITEIKKEFPAAVISVDTNKSKVAYEAVMAGVSIVNDISGGTFDENMFNTVAELQAAYCIMHTPAPPKTMQANIRYTNVIAEIYQFLAGQAERAQKAGIRNIIIDPGIGFGKTVENNFEILSRIGEFHSLGFPILIGVSRKSFLGKSLDLQVNERDIASSMVDMFAVTQGVQIIRTHNTKNAGQLKKICQLLQTQHV